jgi:hypothetical protein
MDLWEIECEGVNWIHLDQDGDGGRYLWTRWCRFSGLQHRVNLLADSDVLEDHTTSIFSPEDAVAHSRPLRYDFYERYENCLLIKELLRDYQCDYNVRNVYRNRNTFNKIGKMYSLEHTKILMVFFTPPIHVNAIINNEVPVRTIIHPRQQIIHTLFWPFWTRLQWHISRQNIMKIYSAILSLINAYRRTLMMIITGGDAIRVTKEIVVW